MLRKIAVLAVLVVVIAAAFASAANLDVSGGTIQAGATLDVVCDHNGVQVDGWGLETDTNSVTSVRIIDIDPNCAGNAMFVKILDTAGVPLTQTISLGSITATTHSFTFPALTPEQIGGIKIWVEGD